MVAVANPEAVSAYNDMLQAYNKGSADVAAALAEQQAIVAGVGSRNQQAISDYAEEYLRGMESGNLDSPPLPAQEEYQIPDLSAMTDAKRNAAIAIQESLNRFTAECR